MRKNTSLEWYNGIRNRIFMNKYKKTNTSIVIEAAKKV